MWIFGLKTERPGTLVHTVNGGRRELLGAMIYATDDAKVDPAFVTLDSSLVVAGLAQRSFAGTPYRTWSWETRELGETTVWRGTFRYKAGTTRAHGHRQVRLGVVPAQAIAVAVTMDHCLRIELPAGAVFDDLSPVREHCFSFGADHTEQVVADPLPPALSGSGDDHATFRTTNGITTFQVKPQCTTLAQHLLFPQRCCARVVLGSGGRKPTDERVQQPSRADN